LVPWAFPPNWLIIEHHIDSGKRIIINDLLLPFCGLLNMFSSGAVMPGHDFHKGVD